MEEERDIRTKLDPKLLARQVTLADQHMQHVRRTRERMLRQYAGPYYASQAAGQGASATGPEPLNMIFHTARAIVTPLVAHNPKCMIDTKNPELKAYAAEFKEAFDIQARKMDLRGTFRTAVFDSLFGAAIIKVALGPGEQPMDPNGWLEDEGQVFAECVDLDDYIVDPNARSRDHAAYEGNKYRLPREYVYDSGLYGPRALLDKLTINHADAVKSDKRTSEISTGGANANDINEWTQYINFVDLWIPDRKVIVTLPADAEEDTVDFLAMMEWEGPDRGPYEMLGLYPIPSNVQPVSLLSILYDLHIAANKQARKQGRQADRQKDIGIYDQRAETDAETIRGSSDGDMLGVQNVDRIKMLSLGGANDKGYEYLGWVLEQISRMGGNTDLLGGAKAVSPTLGQDEILAGNAGAQIEDMRLQAIEFENRVSEKIAWYMFSDPQLAMAVSVPIGAGVSVPGSFEPIEIPGEWEDFGFTLNTYSMAPDDPMHRARRILDFLGATVPMGQMGAAQGVVMDVARTTELLGEYMNIPEADEIWMQLDNEMGPEQAVDAVQPRGQGGTTVNVGAGRQEGGAPRPPAGGAKPKAEAAA